VCFGVVDAVPVNGDALARSWPSHVIKRSGRTKRLVFEAARSVDLRFATHSTRPGRSSLYCQTRSQRLNKSSHLKFCFLSTPHVLSVLSIIGNSVPWLFLVSLESPMAFTRHAPVFLAVSIAARQSVRELFASCIYECWAATKMAHLLSRFLVISGTIKEELLTYLDR
jgi:hypothetical protein